MAPTPTSSAPVGYSNYGSYENYKRDQAPEPSLPGNHEGILTLFNKDSDAKLRQTTDIMAITMSLLQITLSSIPPRLVLHLCRHRMYQLPLLPPNHRHILRPSPPQCPRQSLQRLDLHHPRPPRTRSSLPLLNRLDMGITGIMEIMGIMERIRFKIEGMGIGFRVFTCVEGVGRGAMVLEDLCVSSGLKFDELDGRSICMSMQMKRYWIWLCFGYLLLNEFVSQRHFSLLILVDIGNLACTVHLSGIILPPQAVVFLFPSLVIGFS